MNKNLFKTFAIAAMAVLAGACAKEQVGPSNGETTEVSFNVEVPGVSMVTKGISDAASVNELICQLFIKEGNDYKLIQTYNAPVEAKKASLNMTLVKKQRYYVAFWAQAKGTGYYNTENLQSVTINYDAVKANDPQMDAFWSSVELNLPALTEVDLKKKTNVTLYRAVAQVNFGSKTFDRADALSVKESTISMTGVPNTFNALFGNKDNAYSGSVDQVTYKTNATITGEKLVVGGTDYDYLATAYVFASKLGSLTTASAKFTLTNGKSTTVDLANVPIKRNMRTNILGNLLTFNAEWNVSIDSEFKGGNLFYDSVGEAIAKGGEVTLEEDFSVVPESYGLVIKKGVSTVLNLNGKKFENRNGNQNTKAALQVNGGSLTINGEGEVYCEKNEAGWTDRTHTSVYSNNAILVSDGGHLIINGGNYSVGIDSLGKCNSTIFVTNIGKPGKVEIYGGTFTNDEGVNGHEFVLNQDDKLTEKCITVYGGKFVGFNPASVHEAHGAITSFVAEGYKSVKISESPETWKVEKIPAVTTQEGLNAAIADVAEGETATVYLEAGEYDFIKKDCKGDIVVKGKDKTTTIVRVPNESRGYDNKSISFENVTLNCENTYIDDGRESQFPRTDLHFTNCNINGLFAAIGPTTTSFKECTFTANDYAIKYYGGDKSSKLIVDKCQFNTHGKGILMFNEAAYVYDAEIINCTFTASATISGKAAVQMHTERGIKGNLSIVGSTATGFDSSINGGLWNEVNHDTKEHTTNFNVTVDGTAVQTAK